MARRVLLCIQSVIPFWGDHRDAFVAVRTLRLATILVVALTPLYGLVYASAYPEAFDPVEARLALMAGAAALLAASYRVDWGETWSRRLLVGVVGCLVVWYAVLAWANALNGGYVLGYYFVVLAAAMVGSLVWRRPGPFSAILAFALAVSVGVAWASDPATADISPGVFLTVIVSGEAVVYFAFSGRLLIARDLRASEARLATAETLARTGAWTYHPITQLRTWSDGMYDIVGIEGRPDPPPSVFAHIHPDDYEQAIAEREAFRVEGDQLSCRFRIVRPDGEVRWLQNVLQASRSATGEAVLFEGVSLDITAHVAYEAELEHARDRAETAAAAQASFLGNMSHEVRTPLTAMIGFADLLQDEASPGQRALAEPIVTGGRRLLTMFDAILDLARIDAGNLHLTLSLVELGRLVADAVEAVRPEASAKGLALALDVPDAPLWVEADLEATRRVVAAILSNAITYTEAGHVVVFVRSVGGRAEVEVADTGIGIEAAFVEDGLFEPFRQASSGWARDYEGAGLGLTIARHLAAAMGGSVSVESDPGVGSRFTVALPTASAGHPAVPATGYARAAA